MRRAVPLAFGAVLALGLLAGCSTGPDPDAPHWQSWIDKTEPTGSAASIAGLASTAGAPATGRLDLDEQLTLESIGLGCTGGGTMSFVVTLYAPGGGAEASDSFEHDIVCSDGMATPISHPKDVDTVTRVDVAVTSDDGRGAWRVTLNPAN